MKEKTYTITWDHFTSRVGRTVTDKALADRIFSAMKKEGRNPKMVEGTR